MNNQAHVVLLHGLLHRGLALSVLKRRLENKGFECSLFSYPSRRRDLDGHARALQKFLAQKNLYQRSTEQPLHFVGHSLGGLIIMTLLNQYSRDLPPGRIVMLGSPVRGSEMAKRFCQRPLGRALLGPVRSGLKAGAQVCADHQIGVIAGVGSKGVGRLMGKLPEPNDGTVSVLETQIDAASNIRLPVSHFGLILSPLVARETAFFLQHGRFQALSKNFD